jgi:hypothetical protein
MKYAGGFVTVVPKLIVKFFPVWHTYILVSLCQCSYYMEDTAFYFAWGQFYNRWLFWPAILGLGVFSWNTVSFPLDSL